MKPELRARPAVAPDGLAAWHAIDPGEAFVQARASPVGLTADEAARRLEANGPNLLPQPPRRSQALRFLQQFHSILIYVLIASACVTAAFGHWIDTGVILAVVFGNAVIGFVQEGRAEKAMDAVRTMLAPSAAVLRDGRRTTVDAAELVFGDIVLVEPGDRVPADMRLVEARGLRLEEAILTGESAPVDKRVEAVSTDAPLGDRSSMLFSGTMVSAGTGRGVVVATAGGTEIGRISGMIAQVEALTTPLVRQMDAFARWLTAFILIVAAILIAFGVFVRHLPFDEVFITVVGLSVAAIPEGLPAVLTITLAVGVQAMARRNAIVRWLPAIETLGSVSVICTDKTGTLTRNEMLAAGVVSRSGTFSVGGTGYKPIGPIRMADGAEVLDTPVLEEVALIAAQCNDAALVEADGGWRVEGDPMEGALLALAAKIDDRTEGGARAVRSWTRIDAIPFDAAHRYMAVLVRDDAGRTRVLVKGAPEAVLALYADQRAADGGAEPLDPAFWRASIERLADDGQRVIAVAARDAQPDWKQVADADLAGRLTLIGLVGLIDPPRPESIAAVAECRSAGIRVKMITGDHAGTARAIARRIGLQNDSVVLTGADIDAMSDGALADAALACDVFARTSPAHKLRLVEALQARGLTVAMTGDGVNDAPALKRADAGIAMGRKGSEAAKEASDLVLADDDFASIAAAVQEGRTVYDNIRKVISWTLPTNAGEAATIIVALFAGMALPVTAVQVLWVNLITAITLGLALAFEPAEDGTLRRLPRPRDQPLLTGGLIWHVVFVSLLFLAAVFGIYAYAIDRGYPQELARTMAVNTLVVLEIFHLFFVRKVHGSSLTWAAARGTPVIWTCVAAVAAAQFALTYWPPLQTAFGTSAVPIADGVLIVAVGAVFFILLEIEK